MGEGDGISAETHLIRDEERVVGAMEGECVFTDGRTRISWGSL